MTGYFSTSWATISFPKRSPLNAVREWVMEKMCEQVSKWVNIYIKRKNQCILHISIFYINIPEDGDSMWISNSLRQDQKELIKNTPTNNTRLLIWGCPQSSLSVSCCLYQVLLKFRNFLASLLYYPNQQNIHLVCFKHLSMTVTNTSLVNTITI